MCNITAQRSAGAGLYILGLLVAGIMFMVIGSEYNKSNTDESHLETYFWVYAISMLVGSIGLVLDNGERFCGEEEFKGLDYFGGLFQVVSGFAWAGFGVGIAHYYEASFYVIAPAGQSAADERGGLAWMSGVAAIFHGLGSIFALRKLICCEGCDCSMASIFNIVNIVLDISLIIFWFLFADALETDPAANAGDDDRRTYSYLIGVIYILMSLLGSLLLFDVFCGGDDYEPKPAYDEGYEQRPSYNDEQPTPGYGDEPKRPSYGSDQQPKY